MRSASSSMPQRQHAIAASLPEAAAAKANAAPAVQWRGAWPHAATQWRGNTAGMRFAGEQALARPAEGAVNGRERALLGPGALEQGVCGTPTMAPSSRHSVARLLAGRSCWLLRPWSV
jgi:hypothetical protein